MIGLKLIYPLLSRLIEKLPLRTGKILCNFLILFMIFNMIVSSLALARYTERQNSPERPEAQNPLEELLDSRFTDERMERIYPNAKLVE